MQYYSDDGAMFFINGTTRRNDWGPQTASWESFTTTLQAGANSFQFDFYANNLTPSAFKVQLPNGVNYGVVPEPSTYAQMATGLDADVRTPRLKRRLAQRRVGERAHCGWSPVFPIVDAEVSSDVCPLFFGLGQADALARLCADAELRVREHYRVDTVLHYADGDAACHAAFVGGPVALAWSRFDADTRQRVRRKYLEQIEPWRDGESYRLPGEFVIVSAEAATG